MFTRIATAALAITLLAASASALTSPDPGAGQSTAAEMPSGHTVIEKNSSWPLKQLMSMDPCAVTICQEA